MLTMSWASRLVIEGLPHLSHNTAPVLTATNQLNTLHPSVTIPARSLRVLDRPEEHQVVAGGHHRACREVMDLQLRSRHRLMVHRNPRCSAVKALWVLGEKVDI